MASNVPTVRQVAWLSLIPHLLIMGILIAIFYFLNTAEYFLYGALVYVLLAYALRNFIAKSNKRGMKLVKQRQFREAIPFFEQSVAFFTRNSWVDKYRFLTLLSSSKMSYKEMGLCNIAFCYSQTGDGQQAKRYYELVLAEFPDNGLAIAGINMMTAIEQQFLVNKQG